MEDFDELLAEYGFVFAVPKIETLKLWIKHSYGNNRKGKAYIEIMELLANNVRIKVLNMDTIIEKFKITEDCVRYKKICEKDMILGMYLNHTTGEKEFYFTDERLTEDLNVEILENPDIFGLSLREWELAELYKGEGYREEVVAEFIDDYYELLDKINTETQKQCQVLLQEMEELLRDRTLCSEWLDKKINQR